MNLIYCCLFNADHISKKNMVKIHQFEYKNVAEGLINAGIFSRSEIYYYTDSPIKDIYEGFFQWCMDEFKINVEYYKLKNPCLIFTNKDSINAFAQNGSQYQVINITRGLMDQMYDRFFDYPNAYGDRFAPGCIKHCEKINHTPSSISFELFTQFVFLHELGHLLQGTKIKLPLLQEKVVKLPDASVFQSHLREFDADILAAYQVCLLTVQRYHTGIFKKKFDKNLPVDPLLSYLTLLLAGLLVYFLITADSESVTTLEANTHCHPFVRIGYVVQEVLLTYLNNEADFGKLEKEKLYKQFTSVANELLADRRANFKKLADFARNNQKVVAEYITKLQNAAMANPNLSINFLKIHGER